MTNNRNFCFVVHLNAKNVQWLNAAQIGTCKWMWRFVHYFNVKCKIQYMMLGIHIHHELWFVCIFIYTKQKWKLNIMYDNRQYKKGSGLNRRCRSFAIFRSGRRFFLLLLYFSLCILFCLLLELWLTYIIIKVIGWTKTMPPQIDCIAREREKTTMDGKKRNKYCEQRVQLQPPTRIIIIFVQASRWKTKCSKYRTIVFLNNNWK